MRYEDFIALGIPEEQARAAEEASLRELADYAPRGELEAANQARETETAELRRRVTEARVEGVLGLLLTDAHDPVLAAGLVDRTGLEPGEDGTVPGLSERVEALRRDKPFLFRSGGAGFALGMDPGREPAPSAGTVTMAQAIAARLGR